MVVVLNNIILDLPRLTIIYLLLTIVARTRYSKIR